MSNVPPALKAYFAQIGAEGGKSVSPKKLAAVARNLEKARQALKRPDRPTSSKETARAPIMKSSGKLL